MRVARTTAVVVVSALACVSLACVSPAQARSTLTVRCKPISKTACTVIVSLAGGLPNQPFTVVFPSAGYRLQETGGTPVGKVDWELGPPASAPSDYRNGGTEYVSQISAASTNPPGSKAVITFAKSTPPATTTAPSTAPTVTKGSFTGTCGGTCSLSFALGSGGTTMTGVKLVPPACFSGVLSIGTLPISGGSFNVTINVNNGAAHISIVGKLVSAAKATAAVTAACSGKTTRRTVTLTKRG